jgi:hypothetical protein
MAELSSALVDLKGVPDLKSHLDKVLDCLMLEGLAPFKRISINVGVTKYFFALVSGHFGGDEHALIDACTTVAPSLLASALLLPVLEAETTKIAAAQPAFKASEVSVVDGLRGFPEAIEAVYPQAQIQTCIVHLIRNSTTLAAWKDRMELAAALQGRALFNIR